MLGGIALLVLPYMPNAGLEIAMAIIGTALPTVIYIIWPSIVGDDKFDAVQTACLEPKQEVAPARSALAIGELDREHPRLREGRLWRRPSQSMPIAISTAWLRITPASRTRS